MGAPKSLELPRWPTYSREEIDAVTEILQSGRGNYWFGEQGRNFEREFTNYCGCAYGLTVGNGTLALELALYALGIGDGDEVIVSPRTFIATANSIVLAGARPVFADIDPQSQNITRESVKAAVTARTRAVIAVHLAGWPCEVDKIREVTAEQGIHIIEDCAQAHGAALSGRKIGGLGDAAAFSFCHDKIISTGGEGGFFMTNDEETWARAAAYRNHGKDPRRHGGTSFEFEAEGMADSFGSNFRMTEMQSALGRIQLTQLDERVTLRQRNAAILNERLAVSARCRVSLPEPHIHHAYYRYYFFIDTKCVRSDWSRERLVESINQAGIACSVGEVAEIYSTPAYVKAGFGLPEPLPVAKMIGESCIMLPVHHNLGMDNMHDIAETVAGLLEEAVDT